MALIGKIFAALKATYTKSVDVGSATHDVVPASTVGWEITDGSGDDQAQLLWSDTRQLAASANESLDLAGSLVDALGRTLTYTAVKALIVEAARGNANDVLIGGAASNGFAALFGDATDVVKIKPGGKMVLIAPKTGYAVTAGTGDLLKVANSGSGTAVDYTITVVGLGSAA